MKEEFIAKLAKDYSEGCGENDDETSFKAGFDTLVRLELPVKFHQWMKTEGLSQVENIKKRYGEQISDTAMYDYWIENVYSPLK